MKILSLTHGPQVRPELFGEVTVVAGHELVEWDIAERRDPPDGFDAVFVFGGHQNVGEEAEHPWLLAEYDLLRGWVDSATPLFCVCLGAQTLAHAFDARVDRLPEQQMGFVAAELTDEGTRDPVLGVLPRRFEALVGNSYGFDVPRAAVQLATSAVQPQAYRLGKTAWAVQFHPEARRGQVLSWWEDEADLPRELAEVERELEAKIDGWHHLGRMLCTAFLEEAGRYAS